MRLRGLMRQAVIGCLLGSGVWLPAAWASRPPPDLRVLVDVSGSMRKNDPANLRAPALRLLVELLSADARAGVWTFGQGVSLALKPGVADDAWRRRARLATGQIHSRDAHTDIEQALRAASQDWTGADPGRRRILLLLTDGLVDVGGDPQRSAASRERILGEVLPQLLERGATVYTIGLSQDSDRDLLERVAVATGGWHESVDRAEQLDRVFMRLLTQGTQPDTLPLKDNRFVVDESVGDMTVVAFRAPGAGPAGLQGPDGAVLTADRHPQGVRWRSEPGYDLITVERPAPGPWSIRAGLDPDNRVLVMTNLRLEVEPLPARVLRDESLTVQARLRQAAAPVDQAGFLSLVGFSLEDRPPGEAPRVVALADDGVAPDREPGDGRYAGSLGPELPVGVHELAVVARAGSFEREVRHRLQVQESPIVSELERLGAAPDADYRLSVKAEPALLHLDSLQVRAVVAGPDAPGLAPERVEPTLWVAQIPGRLAGRELVLQVEGLEPTGRPLSLTRTLALTPAAGPGAGHEPAAAPPAPSPAEAARLAPEPLPGWPRVALYVVGLNLALAGLGLGGYRVWTRRARHAEEPTIQVPPGPACAEASVGAGDLGAGAPDAPPRKRSAPRAAAGELAGSPAAGADAGQGPPADTVPAGGPGDGPEVSGRTDGPAAGPGPGSPPEPGLGRRSAVAATEPGESSRVEVGAAGLVPAPTPGQAPEAEEHGIAFELPPDIPVATQRAVS